AHAKKRSCSRSAYHERESMIAPPPQPLQPRPAEPAQPHMRAASVVSSFRYAFAGLRYLLWTQRNAKIHTAIGLVAIGLGVVLGIDHYEWLVLTLTITIVL